MQALDHLIDVYWRYFEVVRADSPSLRVEAYRLRYQVYCIENGFEDPARFPDKLERDGFDDRAEHSLLIHRRTGLIAGTVRLILPDTADPLGLPIYHHCEGPFPFPPGTTAEISRFCISKEFRRRSSDGLYPDERVDSRSMGSGTEEGRIVPSLTMGFFWDMLRMSAEHGITHWCNVMMPALRRLLATRLGLHYTPFGPPIEYRGRRQPCYRGISDLLGQVWQEQPEVWQVLTDDGQSWPAPAARAQARSTASAAGA